MSLIVQSSSWPTSTSSIHRHLESGGLTTCPSSLRGGTGDDVDTYPGSRRVGTLDGRQLLGSRTLQGRVRHDKGPPLSLPVCCFSDGRRIGSNNTADCHEETNKTRFERLAGRATNSERHNKRETKKRKQQRKLTQRWIPIQAYIVQECA